MDYGAAIRELYLEKQRLDKAVETLETLFKSEEVAPVSRRGRKNMPKEEREKVSERMKRFWAARRNKTGT